MQRALLATMFLLSTVGCKSFQGEFRSAPYEIVNDLVGADRSNPQKSVSDLEVVQTSTSSDIITVNKNGNGGAACFDGDCTSLSSREARQVLDGGLASRGSDHEASYIFAEINSRGRELYGFDLRFLTDDALFAITLKVLWNSDQVINGRPSIGEVNVLEQKVTAIIQPYKYEAWFIPGASMLALGYTLNPEHKWYTRISLEYWIGFALGPRIDINTSRISVESTGDVLGDGSSRIHVPYGLDSVINSIMWQNQLQLRVGPGMVHCDYHVSGQLGHVLSCSAGGRLTF